MRSCTCQAFEKPSCRAAICVAVPQLLACDECCKHRRFLELHDVCCLCHTQTFLNEAVDASTEGLIVKTLVDTYEPSKRSSHWLKVHKKSFIVASSDESVVSVGTRVGELQCIII